MYSRRVLIGLLMTIARAAAYGQESGGMQGMPGMTGMNMDAMSGATNDRYRSHVRVAERTPSATS
jgi:hypothetical protein